MRFSYGMNADDHAPTCEIRASRDGWDAACTCGASHQRGQMSIAEDALAEAASGDPEITVGGGRCCDLSSHVWAVEATTEGDTCECGQWYRFDDRIESSDILGGKP